MVGLGHSRKGLGKGCIPQERELSQTWPRAQSREDSGHRSQQGGLRIHVSAERTRVINQGGLRLMSQQEKLGNHIRVLEVSAGRAGKIKLFLWLTSVKDVKEIQSPPGVTAIQRRSSRHTLHVVVCRKRWDDNPSVEMLLHFLPRLPT